MKRQKKVELEIGQIWQVPIWTPAGLSKKNQTLDVQIVVKLRESQKVLRFISIFELVYNINLDQ